MVLEAPLFRGGEQSPILGIKLRRYTLNKEMDKEEEILNLRSMVDLLLSGFQIRTAYDSSIGKETSWCSCCHAEWAEGDLWTHTSTCAFNNVSQRKYW